MPGTHRLPDVAFEVSASPEICLRLVLASFAEVEARSPDQAVVSLDATFLGRTVGITQLVWTHPGSLRYLWLHGPLPFAEGRLEFLAGESGGTEIRHSGTYDPGASLRARMTAGLVASGFRRALLEHLREALSPEAQAAFEAESRRSRARARATSSLVPGTVASGGLSNTVAASSPAPPV